MAGRQHEPRRLSPRPQDRALHGRLYMVRDHNRHLARRLQLPSRRHRLPCSPYLPSRRPRSSGTSLRANRPQSGRPASRQQHRADRTREAQLRRPAHQRPHLERHHARHPHPPQHPGQQHEPHRHPRHLNERFWWHEQERRDLYHHQDAHARRRLQLRPLGLCRRQVRQPRPKAKRRHKTASTPSSSTSSPSFPLATSVRTSARQATSCKAPILGQMHCNPPTTPTRQQS